MRLKIIFPLLVAGVSSFAGAAQAQSSQNYAWCALQPDRSGATTCYFSTYEQCRAAVQGSGSCIRNPAYRGQR